MYKSQKCKRPVHNLPKPGGRTELTIFQLSLHFHLSICTMKNCAAPCATACAAPCATACVATSTQLQRTRKPQRADRMDFHAFNRVYTYKQHASEIEPLMEMQRKMNSARC